MIPVAKLKQNLDFFKNLGDLIEVMKLAATLQFNQFRSSSGPFDEFLVYLEKAISYFPQSKVENIFLKSPHTAPSAIVLISSDESFLGKLNTLLVEKLTEIRQPQDEVIVLGQQGMVSLEELKIKFTSFPSVTDKLETGQMDALRDHLIKLYVEAKISKVYIIYAKFINITFQQVEPEVLLPVPEALFPEGAQNVTSRQLLVEPDNGSVIESWVKLWMFFKFYQIFWSSKLAEFSARIMHLEGSMQELSRRNQYLRLEYFKYLHGLSDKTIREIYASQLAEKAK